MITIQFKFKIGEKVKIRANERFGKIESLTVSNEGKKGYWVRYADKNGAIFNYYFKTEELIKLK